VALSCDYRACFEAGTVHVEVGDMEWVACSAHAERVACDNCDRKVPRVTLRKLAHPTGEGAFCVECCGVVL
jgi:hypothetical protein